MTEHGQEGWGNLCNVYKDRKLSTRGGVCVSVSVCVCMSLCGCLGLHPRIRRWHEMYKKK